MIAFPKIKTERLTLRQLRGDDFEQLFDLRYHDEVLRFIARDVPENKDSIKQFITDRNEDCNNGKIVFWAIQEQNKSRLIGTICLWNFNAAKTVAEVGYELHPDFHNQGFMSEALQAVLAYGLKKMNLNAIEAFTDKDNTNSQLLLEKFNFKYDANREDEGFPNNKIYIKTNG